MVISLIIWFLGCGDPHWVLGSRYFALNPIFSDFSRRPKKRTNKMTQSSPVLPWKTKIALSAISAVTDFSLRDDGTINRRLLSFLDFRAPPNSTPVHGVKTSDVTVDPSRNLWFRLFEPTEVPGRGEKLPVIVFFHGGGFAYLSAYSKAYDAVAGANLAHNVTVRACETTTFREVKVVGLVPIQPFFGGEERTESERRLEGSPLVSMRRTDCMWKMFLLEGSPLVSMRRTDCMWKMFSPEGADRDHEAANVSGPRGRELSEVEFPATMVFIGGFDPLQDWQRRYCEWLKRSGKEVRVLEYGSAIHAFYIFPELPEASLLFAEVKNFRKKIGRMCLVGGKIRKGMRGKKK
ncbi:unnamed protein product, partial [Vitis vinifera]